LATALADEDSEVRAQAALALGNCGLAAKPVVGQLIEALQDESGWVRLRAAWAVWRSDQRAAPIVQVVTDLLDNEDEELRVSALYYLAPGDVGGEGPRCLINALANDDESVRLIAIDYLSQLGLAAKDAVPALTELTKHTDWITRMRASQALDVIDPRGTHSDSEP
jgi:HEAT repeat protein